MLSKSAYHAFNKGYRVQGLEVIGPLGRRIKVRMTKEYPDFNIWHDGGPKRVRVHQLVAWQKFAEKCIGSKIVVRHLDDNKHNFHPDNIEIGTVSQNLKEAYTNGKMKHKQKEEV